MPEAEDAGHGETPADLMELYLALEAEGTVTPGDPRSVTEQVEESK